MGIPVAPTAFGGALLTVSHSTSLM